MTSRCKCDSTKYYGKNCEFKFFDCRDNETKCSGRGECDADFGTCTCQDGYDGEDCEEKVKHCKHD